MIRRRAAQPRFEALANVLSLLAACGHRGRVLLVAGLALGLIGGLVAPHFVDRLRPTIAPIVIALLFLAVLRLGMDGVRQGLHGIRTALGIVLLSQLILPVVASFSLYLSGWHSVSALGVVLILAAAPITGSPNLTILAGGNPVPALRQLVLGTLLLPLTVTPVFMLSPALGDPGEVARVVLRLLVVILLAGGLALGLRHFMRATPREIAAIDGASALLLAVAVVALMGAVGQTLLSWSGWGLLAGICALNFGLQLGAAWIAQRRGGDPVAQGIVSGNRNLALFLGVLPAALVDELMPFVGLYQIPMYLTPVVMPRLYRTLFATSPTASRQ